MGCNVMFCCERYQQTVTVDNVFNCSPSPNANRNYGVFQVYDDLQTTVLRLLELINVMFFGKILSFIRGEFCDLINLICTS